jgi:uncharacterized protein (TIGR03000 family)
MYSVVLAVALTTSSATPDWHTGFGCHGCHGCTGCCGNAFSCHGCCGGCYGCCGGCYGCCGGCYGCCGGSGSAYSWQGFYATTNYNFYSCGGCNGCYGCSGYFPAPVSVPRKAAFADQSSGSSMRVERRSESTERTAQVTVVMPENARLFVDDVPYPTIQEKITFETPKLDTNRTFYYTLKAEIVRDGKVYRENRRVDVAAGKEVKVEFGSLPPLQAAQR